MKIGIGSVSAVLLLAAAGCASSGSGSTGTAPGVFIDSRVTTVRIEVLNLNFQPARLYTYRRGTRSFLGTVAGADDKNFVVDWDNSEPMYIEIDMLAGPKCYTDELMVDPGDILELRIQSVFARTEACR